MADDQIRARVDAGQSQPNAIQAAHVARIAVRVPSGGGRNPDRLLEVVPSQQQGSQNHGMIGNHVAATGVAVIAVFIIQLASHSTPVRFGGADIADVGDECTQTGILYIAEAIVHQTV